MPETATIDLTTLSRDSGYPRAAFEFVDRGLAFTVNRIHGTPMSEDDLDHEPLCSDEGFETECETDVFDDRHITGEDLCLGLRDFAVEQYGMLAPLVLKHWGVTGTEDFGKIVFAMVEAGRMHKTDEDTIEDFRNVFDFREAFSFSELAVEEA